MSRFTTSSTLLDQITADATSDYYDVSLRRKLGVEILLENVKGSASATFSVSNNGADFVTYNRLVTNVADSNTQFDAKVGSYTLDSTTPKTYLFFPEGDYFRYIKAIYTTIDGAIVTYSIDDPGVDYEVDDEITIDDGTGATITVTEVDEDGAVVAFTLDHAGEDYTIGVHAGTGGSGSGFALDVLTVDSGTFTAKLQTVD